MPKIRSLWLYFEMAAMFVISFMCMFLSCMYMVKLRAFRFGTGMHQNRGCTHRKNNAIVVNWSYDYFSSNFHNLHFLDSCTLCASGYILQLLHCVGCIHMSNVIDVKWVQVPMDPFWLIDECPLLYTFHTAGQLQRVGSIVDTECQISEICYIL